MIGGFFMVRGLKAVLLDFREMKSYLIFMSILFIVSVYVGYKSTFFHDYLNGQIEAIGETAQLLSSLENSNIYFFAFIFLNNAIKSIAFIFLGAMFGVLPIFFIL